MKTANCPARKGTADAHDHDPLADNVRWVGCKLHLQTNDQAVAALLRRGAHHLGHYCRPGRTQERTRRPDRVPRHRVKQAQLLRAAADATTPAGLGRPPAQNGWRVSLQRSDP